MRSPFLIIAAFAALLAVQRFATGLWASGGVCLSLACAFAAAPEAVPKPAARWRHWVFWLGFAVAGLFVALGILRPRLGI